MEEILEQRKIYDINREILAREGQDFKEDADDDIIRSMLRNMFMSAFFTMPKKFDFPITMTIELDRQRWDFQIVATIEGKELSGTRDLFPELQFE